MLVLTASLGRLAVGLIKLVHSFWRLCQSIDWRFFLGSSEVNSIRYITRWRDGGDAYSRSRNGHNTIYRGQMFSRIFVIMSIKRNTILQCASRDPNYCVIRTKFLVKLTKPNAFFSTYPIFRVIRIIFSSPIECWLRGVYCSRLLDFWKVSGSVCTPHSRFRASA